MTEEKKTECMASDDTATVMVHLLTEHDTSTVGVSSVGFVLQQMDLCACAAAQKLACRPSVTLSMDDLIFYFSISELKAGNVALIKAQVNRAFNTSMEVGVVIEIEDLQKGGPPRKLCRAFLTFVALGDDQKKTKIPPLEPNNEQDKLRWVLAGERRKLRFRRKEIISEYSKLAEERSKSKSRPRSSAHWEGLRRKSLIGARNSQSNWSVGKPSSASVLLLSQVVLPPHANHYGNTFGGEIMTWMDQAAVIVANRHIRDEKNPERVNLEVISVDDVFFVGPSTVGDLIEITAMATRSFGDELEVELNVVAIKLDGTRTMINHAFWVVHAPGLTIPQVLCETAEEQVASDAAFGRRALRLHRKEITVSVSKELTMSLKWDDSLAEEVCQENIRGLLSVLWGRAPWNKAPLQSEHIRLSSKPSLVNPDVVCLKIEQIIQVPSSLVFEHIVNIDKRKKWDAVMVDADITTKVSEHSDIGRYEFAELEGGTKRDFALLRSWREMADGYAIASCSVVHDSVPQVDGVVRGEVLSSGWHLLSVEPGTTWHNDVPNQKKLDRETGWTRASYVLQLGKTAMVLVTKMLAAGGSGSHPMLKAIANLKKECLQHSKP